MNTLRRIPRHLVKAVAAIAVMVAAALPVAAVAGAATTVTLTETSIGAGTAYAIVGQGASGNFSFSGTGFANDSLLGGSATLTTTAPGVTFTAVTETGSTTGTATYTTSTTTTPGFYPVTLTDDNGTATMALGLGVDVGPQITSVTGNSAQAGSATSVLVTVTGTNLYGATPRFQTPLTGTAPTISNVTNNSDTTLTFDANALNATAGSFTFNVTSGYPTDAQGVNTYGFTVTTAAAPSLTISSVSPSELPTLTNGTSNQNITITGTGFETGCKVTLTSGSGDVTGVFTRVSATSITGVITITASGTAVVEDDNITILNPDATTVTGMGILGIGEAATSSSAGGTTAVAPAITGVSGYLQAAKSAIIGVTGNSAFPITTGATVTVSNNTGQALTGSVVSVSSANVAQVKVVVPYYAETTTTAALTTSSTSIALTSVGGLPASGNVILVDGASTESVAYSAVSGNTLTITHPAFAHASGVSVEFPLQASGATVEKAGGGTTTEAYTVYVNNGSNNEPYAVTVDAPASAGSFSSPAVSGPGTYSVTASILGFGFTTGASISLSGGGSTGTVTVVNANQATVSVTVPATVPETDACLYGAVTSGTDNATLGTIVAGNCTNTAPAGKIAAGTSLTVGPDPHDAGATVQTLTVATYSAGAVTFTSNFNKSFLSGDPVSGMTEANPYTGAVTGVITNGAGEAFVGTALTVGAVGGTAVATPSTVYAGSGVDSAAAPIAFAVTGTSSDTTAANWKVTTSVTGITFTVTGVTSSVGLLTGVDVTATVATVTPATATVPVTITDGYATFTSTISTATELSLTSATATPTLTPGEAPVTVGLYGTGLSATADACTTTDPDVTCVIDSSATNSSTQLTVTYTIHKGATNTGERVVIYDPTTYASANLPNAFTVSGEPVATSISPASILQGTSPGTVTVTGTGFLSGTLVGTANYFATSSTTPTDTYTVTATYESATSVQITDNNDYAPGTVTYTFGDNSTWLITSPAITVAASTNPAGSFVYPSSVAPGSASVPFKFVGENFLAATTLSIPAADGAITVTLVTPNAIFGTVTYTQAVTGNVTATVTNPNGATGTATLVTGSGPVLWSNGATASGVTPFVPYAGVSGATTTLVLTGTGFYPGATVSAGLSVLATFGTPVVTQVTAGKSVACTTTNEPCNTITVPVTYIANTTGADILTSLTVTNPAPYGTETVGSALSLDAGPVVTGTYYVPTFSSNVYITVTGSGFATGMTETSTNSAYTVNLVNVTPNTATLLVSTSSAATSGTSSTITFTNPDGGTVSFPLNGGPQVVASTKPAISSVSGLPVIIGKTTTLSVNGKNLAGSSVRSNGAKVTVVNRSATHIVIKVTPTKGKKAGAYKLTVSNAGGSATYTYSQKN